MDSYVYFIENHWRLNPTCNQSMTFFTSFVTLLKNVSQNNTLHAHLQHIICLLNSLSKVNGKQFLRFNLHKVSPIQGMKLKNSNSNKTSAYDWGQLNSKVNESELKLFSSTQPGKLPVETCG